MHYSRVSIPPDQAYSPATAVLLNELLKGSISFMIAFCRSPVFSQPLLTHRRPPANQLWLTALTDLYAEVFSPDAWKLSIPAFLYVVQNSLQFVAISNLPVATFQVTYQMKILTTAAFSVALLRKKLSGVKWLSLLFLAMGVGIVQLQTASVTRSAKASMVVGSAQEYNHHVHHMSPLKGFGAVTAACFTSGLAGVYFEMVLKGSKSDLWVRNLQLSLFSLIPALLPILYDNPSPQRWPAPTGVFPDLFRNFGLWAWATVAIQVIGGLLTAIVIKYSDNILKGFATSLSIVLSFLASVALFDFRITPGFFGGAVTVLAATWMYNQPASSGPISALPSEKLNECLPLASSLADNKRDIKFPIYDPVPPISSRKSSPSRSYPSSPNPDRHSHHPPSYYPDHSSKEHSTGTASVASPLGVSSFMRRKPPSVSFSRTSSTASLSGLLGTVSDRISSYTTNSTSPGGLGDLASELAGQAENGEVVHGTEGLGMGMGLGLAIPSLSSSSLSTPNSLSPFPSPALVSVATSPFTSASASRAPSPPPMSAGAGKREES